MENKVALSIMYELEAANVKDSDIKYILERVQNRISEENIDIELESLGYPKIFTIDYINDERIDYLEGSYQ